MRPVLLALIASCVLLAGVSASATPSAPRGSGLAYYENPHTLSGVAARFHLTVDEIAALNGIKDKEHFNAHGLVLPAVESTRALPRYVPWTPATPRQTCATTPWQLAAASVPGCSDAYCGSGPGGEHACLCRDVKGNIEAQISAPGAPVARLPIQLSAWNPFDVSTIDVASVDLDADGRPETLVSWLTAVSNGLAEEWRTLVVLKSGRELLRYESGTLTAETAPVEIGGACHLGSAHYEDATHPLRGSALYLVERTFDPMHVRMDREIVGRRCSDKTRYVLPFDPLLTGRASTPRPARTVAYVQAPEHADLRLGDARARRVFPPDLRFGGLAKKEATREHYDTSGVSVLWLTEGRR
jgi:hypothetical protein